MEVSETGEGIKSWGNVNTWKLICTINYEKEGWVKSTRAMEIIGLGCLVQVTTYRGDNVTEAVTFVPDTTICDMIDDSNRLVGRSILYRPKARHIT